MIYVQDDDLKSQLKLLEHFAGSDRFIVVAWQYPEINKSPVPFFPTSVAHRNYEPVTTYEYGVVAKHTKPTKAKPSMMAYLGNFSAEIVRAYDSICLYRVGSREWFACTIGHEGMCLVRDDAFLQELQGKGFNASTKQPDWW
ncbi:hypothetical protein [Teredinibacter turnerae]|uniref:hypothetical protein n=1 Tax=Teredinibacter turnerae TaxID=2426 RepID=UPI00048DFD31|nr:hypothetical protein [Teredinibacter turnerae]